MADVRNDNPKSEPTASAATSSSNTGPAGATEGTFAPAYGKEDPFLGAGAHAVSGETRGVHVDDAVRDSPALILDTGRNPNEGRAGGDDIVRSHGGTEDESVRSADESRREDESRGGS